MSPVLTLVLVGSSVRFVLPRRLIGNAVQLVYPVHVDVQRGDARVEVVGVYAGVLQQPADRRRGERQLPGRAVHRVEMLLQLDRRDGSVYRVAIRLVRIETGQAGVEGFRVVDHRRAGRSAVRLAWLSDLLVVGAREARPVEVVLEELVILVEVASWRAARALKSLTLMFSGDVVQRAEHLLQLEHHLAVDVEGLLRRQVGRVLVDRLASGLA